MGSKYVDTTAITQVIGCVFNNPNLLDNSDYIITDEDFVEDFHKIVFGVIYKLYENGAKSITLESINDFLETRPKKKAIYDDNKGNEYILKVSSFASEMTFNYYYHRVKKMTLLRAYDNFGLDVSFLYDPDNVIDLKKRENQEEWLDNTSLEEIASVINSKISEIKEKYADENSLYSSSCQAGEGIEDLILRFEQVPDIGVPLYGNYINTITRGARLGKFYLRSAPTGIGKTRSMIADACYIGCNKFYDEQFGWIKNGHALPTLFIGTEQDKDEIQTMMLAFLSNVNEEHILNGQYETGERDRVFEAARIIKESPIYIEELPEFNL